MLSEAVKLAEHGRAVCVIAADSREQERLHSLLGERGDKLGIKIETDSSPGNFCWEQMRLIGAHPNCVVLVDHYAIESRFGRILEMLHLFDPEPVRAKE